ncbi:MAG TPA: ABC transporter substrate-binding protein [Solirubrobacteraceae bacterium]|nr:ABC transporter substrate-binding protein [Solirubrobacteraceae bacterium]
MITIGTAIAVNSPILNDSERKAGVEAAISDINAAGGVSGHQVKLDFCDTQYSVNGEIDCARQMVSDHVVAVINPDFLADQTGEPYKILAQAGIPVVGDSGLSPAGMASPNSFPLAGGMPGWVFGADDNAIRAGATKVAVVSDTNPAAEFAGKLAAAGLALAKVKPVAVITADPSSDPTFSSAAAKATAGGVNGIVVAMAPTNLPKFVVAVRQAGYKGIISSLSAIVPTQIIAALKTAANGILLSSQTAQITDTSNPGVAKFLADMKKYQPSAVLDERTETGWAAMMLFDKVAASLPSFTPATVMQAMKSVSTPIDLQIIGPWKSAGATSPIKTFPQLGFNPTVSYGVVKDGQTVTDQTKGFPNPFVNLATGK